MTAWTTDTRTRTTNGIVQRTIRLSSLLYVTIGGVGLVAFLLFVVISARYVTSLLTGPRPIDSTELASVIDVNQVKHYWVTVSGNQAFDTGWQIVQDDTAPLAQLPQKKVLNSYSVLVVGERVLLVQENGPTQAATTSTYTGSLVPIPQDVSDKVVHDIRNQAPDVADRLLPYMLDTSDFRPPFIVGALFGGIILIASGIVLYIGLVRLTDPRQHPIWKRFKRFGDADVVVAAIDDELVAPHPTIASAHITRHWLVSKTTFNLYAAQLDDVAWLYKQSTRRRVNGIPVGTYHSAVVFDRLGGRLNVPANEARVNQLLQAIQQAAPWAVAVYTPQIRDLWANNPQAFFAQVQQRHASMTDNQRSA